MRPLSADYHVYCEQLNADIDIDIYNLRPPFVMPDLRIRPPRDPCRLPVVHSSVRFRFVQITIVFPLLIRKLRMDMNLSLAH